MNRYQFEDLISDYIENELSLSKRKEFEAYLEDNPDAKELIESVRANMSQMKTMTKVTVRADFNDRLLAKIQKVHGQSHNPIPSQRTFFGFSPVHASLMTGLVVAFVFVAAQFFTPEGNSLPSQSRNFAEESIPTLSNPSLKNVNMVTPDLAEAEEDSVSEDPKKKSSKDFSKKMHFVND